jgi:hypothetical protein
MLVRLAGGWCLFVLREKYFWLVAGGWFVLTEKYRWLISQANRTSPPLIGDIKTSSPSGVFFA